MSLMIFNKNLDHIEIKINLISQINFTVTLKRKEKII